MNILDPKFRYVDSYSTDLRKTFARVRRENRERSSAARTGAPSARVVTLDRARKSVGCSGSLPGAVRRRPRAVPSGPSPTPRRPRGAVAATP